MGRIEDLISSLNLQTHPEGGFFCETYRSAEVTGDRNLATSIYFLITGNNVSNFHRIRSDELWYFHEGDSLTVHSLIDGKHVERHLGIASGDEQPFQVVPKGEIFGSCIRDPQLGYSLVSCAVAPGFDFRDFELFTTAELLKDFPHAEAIIRRLSKESYE